MESLAQMRPVFVQILLKFLIFGYFHEASPLQSSGYTVTFSQALRSVEKLKNDSKQKNKF
jgi:hypothetical protein